MYFDLNSMHNDVFIWILYQLILNNWKKKQKKIVNITKIKLENRWNYK